MIIYLKIISFLEKIFLNTMIYYAKIFWFYFNYFIRKFRWKDNVTEKGDKARTHVGIIAQDLQDAFKAESLDASKYAMFCSDTWWQKEISVDAVEAIEVIDLSGRVIMKKTEGIDAKHIDVSALKKGCYIVKLKTSHGIVLTKIIKD